MLVVSIQKVCEGYDLALGEKMSLEEGTGPHNQEDSPTTPSQIVEPDPESSSSSEEWIEPEEPHPTLFPNLGY